MTARDEQQPEIRCQHCDRPLTAERSRRNRAGDACRYKARRNARPIDMTAWKDAAAAIDKADQLIADGALTQGDVPGTWLAVSSHGSDVYEVDAIAGTCTCKARERWGHCTHVLAARHLSGRPYATAEPRDSYALAA